MGRKFEAQTAYELLISIDSNTARKAVSFLKSQYDWLKQSRQVDDFVNATLDPAPNGIPAGYWTDKLATQAPLGRLEEKLIGLLAQKPQDKFLLISELYGTDLPISSTEPRLKNIIYRMRKRFPDLIQFRNGSYELNTNYSKASGA